MFLCRYCAPGLALFLAWQAPPAVSPGVTYYVSLTGDDHYSGAASDPWRHIEWALTRPFLRGGDTIRIRGGIYRPEPGAGTAAEALSDDAAIRPVAAGEQNRPITVMAEPGETVVLSGRRAATEWQPAGASPVYYHVYDTPAAFPYDHPFQIVEDGKLLFRVSSLEALDHPGRSFVDTTTRRIYVRTSDDAPPNGHVLEYAVAVSGVEFRGVSHWRLSGFALTGFRSAGILIAGGAGHIELDQMDISYSGAHRPGADPTNGYAVAIYDTSGGNYVHDSRLHNTFAEAVHISQTGAGGDLWEHNEIREAGGPEWFRDDHSGRYLTGPGMILRGSRVRVRGNRFLGNGYHGLILESDLLGTEGPAQPGGNVIEGNVFSRNAASGVYADGKNGTAAAVDNVIRFNLLCRNDQARRGSVTDAELRLAGNFRHTRIYNNTIYADQANGVLVAAVRTSEGTAQGGDAAPQGTVLVNNIVVHAANGPGTRPLRVTGGAGGLLMDANDWYRTNSGALIYWQGTDFDFLGAFTSGTGLERRGFAVDPQFVAVDQNLFGLRAASPLIGRGLPSLEGSEAQPPMRRRQLPVDLGAYPYGP